jgi:hypothetical protein
MVPMRRAIRLESSSGYGQIETVAYQVDALVRAHDLYLNSRMGREEARHHRPQHTQRQRHTGTQQATRTGLQLGDGVVGLLQVRHDALAAFEVDAACIGQP